MTLRNTMLSVVAATLPALAWLSLQHGWIVLIQCLTCALLCVAVEALALRWRGRSLQSVFDGSAALCGWLLGAALPLTLPIAWPWSPLWLWLTGALVAIGLVKQLYGGLGHNVFNPAMVAYAFLLLAFPQPMAQADALSGASVLDLSLQHRLGAAPWPEFGFDPVIVLWSLGGAWLWWRGILSWRLAVGVLASALLVATVVALFSEQALSPWQHLNAGALVFGAWFIATDPVTAPSSRSAQWAFGAIVGAMTVVIRSWGAYPEGFAFAIVFANAMVPLLDRWGLRWRA